MMFDADNRSTSTAAVAGVVPSVRFELSSPALVRGICAGRQISVVDAARHKITIKLGRVCPRRVHCVARPTGLKGLPGFPARITHSTSTGEES